MMKANEWLVGLCVTAGLGSQSVLAQTYTSNSSNPKVTQAIAAVKDLCLAGSQYDFQVDAKGNLSLWRIAPGGEGSVSFDVRHSSGAAAIFDDQVRRFADEDIRACMKPYIERIIDAILGGDEVAWKASEAPSERSARHLAACPAQAAMIEIVRQALRAGGSGPGAATPVWQISQDRLPRDREAVCHAPGVAPPPFDDVVPCAFLFGS